MRPSYWVPVVVFLAVSIPAVLLLNALGWGGEFRLWIAIGAGALASALAQRKLNSGKDSE